MKEIEVKILDVNPAQIRTRLKKIGAKKYFDGDVHAVYFDTADDQLKKKGVVLRVRTAGDRVELCAKGNRKKSRFKNIDEFEVVTGDYEQTVALLQMLGYVRRRESIRRRECYKLGAIKYDLDFYPGIPPFIEVESGTEDDVVRGVEKLGYMMDNTTNMTAQEVEAYYKSEGKND